MPFTGFQTLESLDSSQKAQTSNPSHRFGSGIFSLSRPLEAGTLKAPVAVEKTDWCAQSTNQSSFLFIQKSLFIDNSSVNLFSWDVKRSTYHSLLFYAANNPDQVAPVPQCAPPRRPRPTFLGGAKKDLPTARPPGVSWV